MGLLRIQYVFPRLNFGLVLTCEGLFGYFYLAFDLLIPTRAHAIKTLHRASTFTLPALLYVGLLWVLYPIAWGVSEGGNFIAPDSEAVFYGVIDLFAFMFVPIHALVTMRTVDVKDLATSENGFGARTNGASTEGVVE